MVKVPSFSFEKCFRSFTMLLVKGSSETGLVRHLSNHVFGVRKFKSTSAMRVILFLKMFKIERKISAKENSENIFCFSDSFTR